MDTNLLPAFLFPLPLPWCAPRPCLPRRRPGEVPSAHTGQKGQAPGRGLQPITSSLFTLTSYFYLAPPQGEPRKKHHRKPLRLCDSPPLSPLRGQLPLQGGARRRCRAPARRGYPGGAAPPGNSPGGRIELESCGAGHKVNCPRRGKRESPGGCACAAHHCLRPRRPQPPSPCEGEGRSTAQPLAALPPYGCGVPLAGKERARPLFKNQSNASCFSSPSSSRRMAPEAGMVRPR